MFFIFDILKKKRSLKQINALFLFWSDILNKTETNNHNLNNSKLRNFSTRADNCVKNVIFLATSICVYAVKYRIFSVKTFKDEKSSKIVKFPLAHWDSIPWKWMPRFYWWICMLTTYLSQFSECWNNSF